MRVNLVDPTWLTQNLHDPNVRVIDLRWYLSGKQGLTEYQSGHIPGAVFLDLEKDLTARAGPGRHPIPGAGQLERAMRMAGVNPDTMVVVYDDAYGSIAARLWWLLRFFGHSKVVVLNGGIQAWLAQGGTISTEIPTVFEGSFSAAPPDHDAVIDKSSILELQQEGEDILLLDARAPERYRGEIEPIDARAGHIPKALNAAWKDNLKDGFFLSPEELKQRYGAFGVTTDKTVIVYCGSGVTACHDILALEQAGFKNVKLYEGSWSDWAKDPKLPLEK